MVDLPFLGSSFHLLAEQPFSIFHLLHRSLQYSSSCFGCHLFIYILLILFPRISCSHPTCSRHNLCPGGSGACGLGEDWSRAVGLGDDGSKPTEDHRQPSMGRNQFPTKVRRVPETCRM